MARSPIFAILALCTIAATATADIVDVGYFYNIGEGDIFYEGDFAPFITSEEIGNGPVYTKITIDVSSLLESIDVAAFRAISVWDTGENAYNDAPGADIDLFRINGLRQGIDYAFSYDGPTEVHQNETPEQLASRVAALDWGTGGQGLSAGTFVSLGELGELTATLSGDQYIGGNSSGDGSPAGDPVTLEISEVGSVERFRIFIDTVPVPAPGALALLGIAGLMARPKRQRC